MELMDVIRARRSVRSYEPDPISQEVLFHLMKAAILAPSAMNLQPWAFGVISDSKKISHLSDRVKAFLLGKVAEWPWLAQFKERFESPDYNVFYNAPAVIVIYASSSQPTSQIDCALAAENLMLAACDLGLGTCWIGFARELLDLPEVKREMKVPEEYTAVAPIIVGHPAEETPAREKNPPDVLYWS